MVLHSRELHGLKEISKNTALLCKHIGLMIFKLKMYKGVRSKSLRLCLFIRQLLA